MDEKDWEIIQVLNEKKNITQASKALHLTQPAITYRIKRIEEDIGAQIFIRNKNGIEFTPQGNYLVEYSENMLRELNNLRQNMQRLDTEVQGVLRIAVASNYARYKLPTLLKLFSKKHPKVEFIVNTGWSSQLIPLIQRNDVHLAIIRGDYNWQYKKILLHQENVSIVSSNPFEINDLPKMGRIKYKTDVFLRNTITDWWQSRFILPPKISMEVDHISTCIEMVKHGLGYGIFPNISLNQDEDYFTMKLSDKNDRIIERNTWLLYRESSLQLPLIEAFIDFTEKFISLSDNEIQEIDS